MIQSTEPSLQNESHTHANYQSSYHQKREQQDWPLLRLRRLRAELDSNSVGPELTQERANEHARHRQNPSVAETPPEADHHREPTHAAHKPKSSTKIAQQGKGTKQALPTIVKQRVTSAAPPSESRRCLQEEHDTEVPPPPDPRILGFHPEEAEKRRLASQLFQEGNGIRGRRRRGPEGRFPLGEIRPPSAPHNTIQPTEFLYA
jgi:hypothetical protein